MHQACTLQVNGQAISGRKEWRGIGEMHLERQKAWGSARGHVQEKMTMGEIKTGKMDNR
jgi:hypothetical protein